MDRIKIPKQITYLAKKYRYVILIFLVGLVFMTLPGNNEPIEAPAGQPSADHEKDSIDEALTSILSQIEGAGRVQVMLTVAAGEETVFQSDGHNSESSSTVIITDAQRNQTGLVRQILAPRYLGAVIVCQGADSPAVRFSIVDAVSKITGLGADKISVLKMK